MSAPYCGMQTEAVVAHHDMTCDRSSALDTLREYQWNTLRHR